jgi:C4-dicarboxylate transporter DctM subunit
MPVFMSLAISSVVALTFGGYLPMSVIHNSIFDGLNIFPLLAIPCFVIAGTLMEYGNITNQIVDVVKQMVGRMHGGLGITTILACTFSRPSRARARAPWRPWAPSWSPR